MFSFLKNLFRDTRVSTDVPKSSSPAPTSGETSPAPEKTPAKTAVPSAPAAEQVIAVPLAPVFAKLPPALRQVIEHEPSRNETLRLPVATAVEQLANGVIKVRFRDIKAQCRPGLLKATNDFDDVPVEVPLVEVLSRLRPTCLARRPGQKTIPLPEDVGTVFVSKHGSEPAPRIEVRDLAAAKPVEARDDLSASRSLREVSLGSSASHPPSPSRPLPSAPAVPSPAPAAAATCGLQGTREAVVGSSPQGAENESATVKVALGSLARGWPEATRQAILQTHLAASVHIPVSVLEAALTRGKATFPWSQIRLWLSPKPIITATEHDQVILELPLQVLVPAFLARRPAENPARKRLQVDEMPDVFAPRKPDQPAAAKPAASPASHPDRKVHVEGASRLPEPAEAPRPVPAPAMPAVRNVISLTPSEPPAPVRSGGTPAEVVQRACRLNEVAGALVATPDGLSVAAELPAGLAAERLAAVLPQIFNRLSQYTQELKLGDPVQIEVQLDKTLLQVHKTNQAYLAVVGKPSESLPKAQLSVLASQLSARTK